ncbi:MAG: FixJ family two-component response regulator [Bradymonadia bacterium]
MRQNPSLIVAVATTFVVDDHVSIRRSLKRLSGIRGYIVSTHPGAQRLFDVVSSDASGCIVRDPNLPDRSGIESQRRLAVIVEPLPGIFLAGRGTVASCSEALKTWAVDFLEKSVDESVLCAAIDIALQPERRGETASGRASGGR